MHQTIIGSSDIRGEIKIIKSFNLHKIFLINRISCKNEKGYWETSIIK